MIDARFSLPNYYWSGDELAPRVDLDDERHLPEVLGGLDGQFSLAATTADGRIVLVRDKHGVNKLFFAIGDDGGVRASNYLIDLVQRGVAFEEIYSVPAGHYVIIDPRREQLSTRRYYEPRRQAPYASLAEAAHDLRAALEDWFARLARTFRDREISLCLSGGLDSSLIGALAVRHLPAVTAFTYTFVAPNQGRGEDATYARGVAAHLGVPWHEITATRADVLAALENALVYGQDWRDFNVHCAIVNDILGRGMSARPGPSRRRVVLTGDMMNEIVADYSPVTYRGREYYTLPPLPLDQLRLILVKGLDAGDREVGVFGHHGLDVVQPYGLVLDKYLRIPAAWLAGKGAKQTLVRAIAGDLLPPFVFDREKVRAQIGTSGEPSGILPVLVDAGCDSARLWQLWRERFHVPEGVSPDRFIRAGFYRVANSFPLKRRYVGG